MFFKTGNKKLKQLAIICYQLKMQADSSKMMAADVKITFLSKIENGYNWIKMDIEWINLNLTLAPNVSIRFIVDIESEKEPAQIGTLKVYLMSGLKLSIANK